MDLSVKALILNGFSNGVGVAFGSIFGYLALRYFPKVWARVEVGLVSSFVTLGKLIDGKQVGG